MFRQAPLKTYQRKKTGGASTTINSSLIVRENVPKNKNLQPKEFLAFKDTDDSLEYDPFDTTFDRIAKDVRMPPIPPKLDDDSYSSSSSDEAKHNSSNDSDSEPLPDPLPIINPKRLRGNLKNLKLDKDVSIVKIELKAKMGRKKNKIDSSFNENANPHFGRKLGKRKKNIKDSEISNNITHTKKRRAAEKPVVSTSRDTKKKNFVTPQSLKRCTVNLTRVDISLSKSTDESNSTDNISNSKIIAASYLNREENLEASVEAQSIIMEKEKNTSILKNPTPKKFVEDQKMSLKEKENTTTFKNPTVSLTRLNISQPRVSIADKVWLNSTPMTAKTIRTKSSLHFSPITDDQSISVTDHNDGDSYESQNLLPEKTSAPLKSLTGKNLRPSRLLTSTQNDTYEGQTLPPAEPNVQSKNLTPTKSKISRFSSRTLLLSASPDAEPSELMFEDTETIASTIDSHDSLKVNEDKTAAEASTMSTFMGSAKDVPEVVVAESRPAFRSVLAPIENYSNTKEATTISSLKDFTKDSTDSESLHLTLDESNKTEISSKQLTPPFKKIQQAIPKIRLIRLADSATYRQNRWKESTEGLKNSSEISSTNLHKTSEKSTEVLKKNSEKSIELQPKSSDEVTREEKLSDRSIKVLQQSLDESVKIRLDNSNENAKDLQTRLKGNLKNRQSRWKKRLETRQDSLQDDSVDLQTRSKRILRNRSSSSKRSSESLQTTPNESQENSQRTLDLSAYDTNNISKAIAEDWESSAEECSEHATDQINLEDEWETITDSPKSNLSRVKGSESIKAQRADVESIMNVSSDEGNTSCDDYVEFVNASQNSSQTENDTQNQYNSESESDSQIEHDSHRQEISSFVVHASQNSSHTENDTQNQYNSGSQSDSQIQHDSHRQEISSFVVHASENSSHTENDTQNQYNSESESDSQIEHDSHRQEISSFDVHESSEIETISKCKAKADESSVIEITYDKMLIKNIRCNSLEPVVLLSRCRGPIRASKRISHNEDSRLDQDNDCIYSIKDSSVENEDDDVRKSINQSLDSESIEWNNEGDEIGKSINQSLASESIEWNKENDKSQESQDEMTSLRADELSGDGMNIEEPIITDITNKDSTNSSLRSSITKVRKANESSSEKNKINKRNEEESFEVTEVSMKKSQVEESRKKILAKDSLKNSHPPHPIPIEPVVLLNRLNDAVRIGDRRKKYRNWGLTAISEDQTAQNVTTIDLEPEDFATADTKRNETDEQEINEEPKIQLRGNEKPVISQQTTVSFDTSILSNQSNLSMRESKTLFLKPGKSWSRSLSLIRQLQSQDDLESFAFGKGKKWRQSVQAVLNMQQQGVIQSCVQKNADDKESRSSYGIRNSAAAWIPGSSQPNSSTVFSQTSVGSPGRFIRRISIRVVPDRKNSELYEDSPFLEAYGITSTENRKTIGKTSPLIAPRETLVYNVQCAEVPFKNIPKGLSSVTSRDVVLTQCGQDTSVPFETFYPDSYLRYCRKIGEGVFGEVFLYEKDAMKSVIKIIPIEGELKVNGERQKKFDEILSEIVIAKELNNLRFADTCKTCSFVEVKNIRCVVGNYPPMLINLWNTFDNEKHSENDCPEMFDKDQLYIVLELGHGGQDLEAFVFQNSSEAHALFIQTALALAVAEEALEFEHRDLHWGNILISRTEDSRINYKLRDQEINVASKGVKVSVIDFTLSRMSYQGCSIFNDLSLDDDLFAAQGEYQFEIYRLMRQKVENNWQTFEPFTNILWLHYTLDKMITAVRYRRTATKIHKNGIEKLKVLKNEILDYKSAFDFVTNCDNVTRLQGGRSHVSTVSSTD